MKEKPGMQTSENVAGDGVTKGFDRTICSVVPEMSGLQKDV
jgi:hypothetical protein